MGATYGPVTILCALVDLQVKQSVVTKRHGMQRLRYCGVARGKGVGFEMGFRGANWGQAMDPSQFFVLLWTFKSNSLSSETTWYATSWLT